MHAPKISIIGLTYRQKELLPHFIDSVYASSLPREDVEIIIVDNASGDGTVEMLQERYSSEKYSNLKVIARTENIGSSGINDGMRVARGEYWFFTDTDMTFEPHCLENFYNTAKKLGPQIILGPTLYEYDNHDKLMPCYSVLSRSFFSTFVLPQHNDRQLKEVFMEGFPFMHRDTAKKLRYIFDNDYFLYSEDFDLCLRMRLQGFKLYNCPTAIMYNRPPSETTLKYLKLKTLIYYMERNYLITFFKICSLKSLLLYSPYVFAVRVVALLKELVTLNVRLFGVRLKAYTWVLFHPVLVWRKRKETQAERVVSDKEIFKIADEKYFWKAKLGWLK